MRSPAEIERQIQTLHDEINHLKLTISLLDNHQRHLEAIESFWVRVGNLSSRKSKQTIYAQGLQFNIE